jgi:hypothetical protein
MNSVYKIITYCTVSFTLSLLAFYLQSDFVNKFSDNLISLLTTLLTINIASSTLIAIKVSEIKAKTGYHFNNTRKNLKVSFYEQIILIAVAFVAVLIGDSSVLKCKINSDYFEIGVNSVLFYTFINYLDIIKDIGKSLFDLLDFGEPK